MIDKKEKGAMAETFDRVVVFFVKPQQNDAGWSATASSMYFFSRQFPEHCENCLETFYEFESTPLTFWLEKKKLCHCWGLH